MQPQAPESQKPALPGAFDLFSPSISAVGLNIWTFIKLLCLPLAFLLGIFVLTFSIYGIAGSSFDHASGPSDAALGAITVFAILLGVLGTLSFIVIVPAFGLVQLRSAQGVKIGAQQALQESRKFFWRYLGLRIVQSLIYLAGLMLFVVPFFFWWKRYVLARYYLMDRNLSVGAALSQSAAESKQCSDAVWGLIGVLTLFWAANEVLSIFGTVLNILYGCAPALRYLQITRALRGDSSSSPDKM